MAEPKLRQGKDTERVSGQSAEVLPKLKATTWSKDFEAPILQGWLAARLAAFDANTEKPIYTIDTPPPYVNTPVHMGHAATYAIMDMIARFKRMTGHAVLFPLGLDRNGLPIEVEVEKKFKVHLQDVPRENFLGMCKQVLEETSAASEETFKREGIGFNSWTIGPKIGEVYLTDSEDYRKLTQATFIELWNKGLIYEDERTNNYCPVCRTTIADAEIEYADFESTFNHIKFKVKETGEDIVIATTRPELIATCGMVIFNPADERYKRLAGKKAITPIYEKEVLIKAHPAAKMEAGTGLAMMCSFGDNADIRFFREQKLKPTIAIDENGRMNEAAGVLKGFTVEEARVHIINILRQRGLLVKQEKIVHPAPTCERSKNPIEFIAQKEWYLKQLPFVGAMKKIAKSTNFFAPESRQILLDWINSVTIDWPISRRRYYATEIPLWHCAKCGHIYVPPKGKYYRPWKENPPIKACPKCKSTTWKGEDRVFDTWFDSSITPLYILGYGRDEKFWKKVKGVCSLRPQGKEIVRTWLYYTLLRCHQLTGKGIFKDVWIHHHILDDKGFKMSKSKGNVIDPKEVLDRFGAEPLRLWVALEGNLHEKDFRCSFERIEGASKFLTKLWNVARYVSQFPESRGSYSLTLLDRWILNEINELVKYVRDRYEEYDFHNPAIRIRHFIWETFASHYVEMAKQRAYNQEGRFSKEEQAGAHFSLNFALKTILHLLAPVAPFIASKLYAEIFGDSAKDKEIQTHIFPKYEPRLKAKIPFKTADLEALNSAIWKAKKDAGKSLKSEVAEVTIPKKFRPIEKDLVQAHHIKKINWGSDKEELKIKL